jgi:hypothetical protein
LSLRLRVYAKWIKTAARGKFHFCPFINRRPGIIGEKKMPEILWEGKPDEKLFIRSFYPSTFPVLIFFILNIFFSICPDLPYAKYFLTTEKLGPGPSVLELSAFALFQSFFLYFSLGRLWLARREYKNYHYYISKDHIMIERGIFKKYKTLIPIAYLKEVILRYHLGKAADKKFGAVQLGENKFLVLNIDIVYFMYWSFLEYYYPFNMVSFLPVALVHIEDPEKVYFLLKELMKNRQEVKS